MALSPVMVSHATSYIISSGILDLPKTPPMCRLPSSQKSRIFDEMFPPSKRIMTQSLCGSCQMRSPYLTCQFQSSMHFTQSQLPQLKNF
ncbi:predicted protein [Sclerotinia sclerotiorum 1980 UF-70]|uniref:Uncharacterized protein n=1 Tax=Sclerotinia sclerotiorum (strain ATCC 18683 / 1980 / Ss-1) TaxID=665079 RepID=A7EHQ5_SCLS1|nr:predicted protein [Sclerotinia sclerotiorum 1980 UF-70]EDO02371.1 predicted protein [Sclerotinia sclerotiorum 1980 UF-70]